MRITKLQREILDSFTCQRLSADPGNKKLVKTFHNSRNPGLAAYLQYCGWEEDTSGAATFYLIKDHQNRIVMYFSLKCGSLFDPLNLDELIRQVENYNNSLEAIHNRRRGTAQKEELALVEQLMQKYGMNIIRLEQFLKKEKENLQVKVHDAKRDLGTDPFAHISQVVRTYPAVELVHFVANEEYKVFWEKLAKKYKFGKPHTMAQILFWYFVAPILSDIQKVLGCQYIYLFAADQSLNKRLINFYASALNFTQEGDIGTTKPRYDFTCEFMYQEIAQLRAFREEYFDNFNLDPKADIV